MAKTGCMDIEDGGGWDMDKDCTVLRDPIKRKRNSTIPYNFRSTSDQNVPSFFIDRIIQRLRSAYTLQSNLFIIAKYGESSVLNHVKPFMYSVTAPSNLH